MYHSEGVPLNIVLYTEVFMGLGKVALLRGTSLNVVVISTPTCGGDQYSSPPQLVVVISTVAHPNLWW